MPDTTNRPTPEIDPLMDAQMLRRCVEACRNVAPQSATWFTWVPEYLDGLADRLQAEPLGDDQ